MRELTPEEILYIENFEEVIDGSNLTTLTNHIRDTYLGTEAVSIREIWFVLHTKWRKQQMLRTT
jgi:hypothetical protein